MKVYNERPRRAQEDDQVADVERSSQYNLDSIQ